MKFPYGVADFSRIRSQSQVYVDRTGRIRTLEDLGDSLLFLRPRRFGKSLWLSTLDSYYDVRREGEHDRLFSGLEVGRAPTPQAHRYFVMRWDFSKIDPDPPPWGVNVQVDSRYERIGNELRGYLNTTIEVFQRYYRQHLPEVLELAEDPFHNFERLLSVILETPYRLYLSIDEYDNFANEVLTDDAEVYHQLVKTDGTFKYLFKWVKGLMGGAGLERLFITGVSPLVMSDVTSGMNVARNVSLKPALADLCGFTEAEVDDLLATTLRECGDGGRLDAEETKLMMREWYNGYRFALGTSERVYNPTLVFYFLLHLLEEGSYPRLMLDSNLAVDEGKLEYLAQVAADPLGKEQPEAAELGGTSRDTMIDLIRKGEPLEIQELRDRFTLKELMEHSAQDSSFVGSYLFYFGMLTLRKEETEEQGVELVVPNEVVHALYVERLRKILMPLGAARTAADAVYFAFMRSAEIEPLLDFIETTLLAAFSNRDARWANELTVKTVFLAVLWKTRSYITHSEPELGQGYADLCLLRRPDARDSSLWDLLFEFKRLLLKELGVSGKDVKAMARAELVKLPKVEHALDETKAQAVAYRAALTRSRGDTLKLRSYAVVALGFARLVVRPI